MENSKDKTAPLPNPAVAPKEITKDEAHPAKDGKNSEIVTPVENKESNVTVPVAPALNFLSPQPDLDHQGKVMGTIGPKS